MAGVILFCHLPALGYHLLKGLFCELSHEIKINFPDLFSAEIWFIPQKFIHSHIEKSGKLGQQRNIRNTLLCLPF